MKIFHLFSIAATAILLAACTNTLQVEKLEVGDTKVQSGLAYSLQFTQFKIDVTRTIAKCERTETIDVSENVIAGGPPPRTGTATVTIPDVKALVKADISVESVDDGNHVYVIDTESLNGATKISDLSLTWDNGRLTAVNASANDQSAEIISSFASGIGKLAVSNTLRAAQPGALSTAVKNNARTNPKIVLCRPEIAELVKQVALHNSEVKKLNGEISQLTQSLSQHESDLAKVGKSPGLDCSTSQNSTHPQCLLTATIADLRAKQGALETASRRLKEASAKVTHKETYRWPEESTEFKSGVKGIPQPILQNWLDFNDAVVTTLTSTITMTNAPAINIWDVANDIPDPQQSMANFSKEFDVHFSLGRIGSYGLDPDSPGASVSDGRGPEGGIRYRLPANGYVTVCKEADCDRDDEDVVSTKLTPIQQLGLVFSVPFNSKPFTNASVAMTFDQYGRPVTAAISSKEAPLENIAGNFNDIADQLVSYREAVAEAYPVKTDLELLQEQTALLEAQKELAEAQRSLDTGYTPLQELQDKTEYAIQEKKYLDALQALNPPVETLDATAEELAAVESDTTLIMAETARLEARIALRQAEQALADSP